MDRTRAAFVDRPPLPAHDKEAVGKIPPDSVNVAAGQMAAGMCVNGAYKNHLEVYALGCVKQPSTRSAER
jgi:hypothetical protein